jgi:PAS domain S-box-containing protein
MHGRSDAGEGGLEFLHSGGQMGALMRAHDWASSPLGTPETWPQSLRLVVGLMLGSKFPMFVAWGPELGFLYNDAYAEILGAKHPAALGARFHDIWSEIWPDISPLIDAALTGEATYRENLPLLVHRNGFDEQAWFTFSYSPVRDEAGRIAGMYCAVAETTQVVLAERRRAADTERQRRLFEQAPGFITILTGPEHVFEFTNAAYRRLFGDRGYVGKTAREVFPELVDQAFFELLDGVYATGKRFVADHILIRFERADGAPEERFLDFIYEPVTDEVGSVTGIFVEGYDVTDAHWAEAALRESEARYRTLFEAVDAGFCVVELMFDGEDRPADYRFVEANPAFERQTGLQNAVGRTARELVPNLEPHWFEIYGGVARTGDPVRFENGSDAMGRWFEVYALRVGDPQDHRVAILFNDISERRRAEECLRELNEQLERRVAERTAELTESQRRFQGIFDSALQFMALLTPGGTVVEVNQTALAWSRITPDDIVGKPFWLAAPMRDNPALQVAVEAGIRRAAAGETVREEYEMRGAGDVRATIDFSLKPVPSEHGEPNWLVAEGRDITELKEAQEALRQSQKMEAMGQLTGGVAHDFNNLLTPIIGSLDMLVRRGVGSERERRLIDGALQSAERAKTLVQRLLAFARRQPLQPVAVNLEALVDSMAGLIGSTLGPHIDVRVEIEPDLPPAKADPNQLEMALLNLAVNARDAMPDGGTLTIRAARGSVRGRQSELKQGHYVRLSVTDTGVGMDEATRTRAVEPFFSTKGIGKGTGLGLSMVHGLTGQLGGGLTIESTPSQGTTVELWLPVSLAPIEEDGTNVAAPRPAATRGRALLVDDEDLVRMSTADMLMDLGYEVIEAGSAEEAQRLLDDGEAPDLLITDHLMPGISGAELARQVRSIRPDLPVLVISGYAEVDGIAPDLPRLTKPFRNAELAASIAALTPAGTD